MNVASLDTNENILASKLAPAKDSAPAHVSARWLVFALLFALSLLARAGEPGSGELRGVDTQGKAWSLASLDTDVEYQVTGMVAEVSVQQRFRNNSADWLQAEYLLPLPDGVAVYAMTLHVGDRTIVGEIKEKEAARKVFEQASAAGHKTALIEADGGNLFRTAAANIAPGETVEIELHYWQRIEYENGLFSLRFPLTYTPRYRMRQGATLPENDPGTQGPEVFAADTADAPLLTSIKVTLDAGVPLADIASPSHDLVSQPAGDLWRVHLAKSTVVPDRDFVLQWRPQAFTQPNVASFSQSIGGEHYAMLMVLPPQQQAQTLPRELILVIDTSGSMGGESIRQARAALDVALTQLRPVDRFNVIEFNSVMNTWRSQAVPATPALVAEAREWVAELEARGGTEMEPALRFALQGHAPEGYVRQVVFATDAAVDNPGGLLQLIDTELGASRLFPIGIGSAPNVGFLHDAARHGRGSETMIADINQVKAALRALTAKLMHPAARNLHVDWPTGSEVYPSELPDLYLGEPLLVIARVPQALDRVQISAELAQQDWTAPVDFARTHTALGLAALGLDRLWAQSKISDLEGQLARGGELAELRPMIIDTALKAHLVSRFTSLVAVDQTPARSADAPLTHTQLPNLMPAGTHFAQTATPAPLLWWLALALLFVVALLWRAERAQS